MWIVMLERLSLFKKDPQIIFGVLNLINHTLPEISQIQFSVRVKRILKQVLMKITPATLGHMSASVKEIVTLRNISSTRMIIVSMLLAQYGQIKHISQ